MSNPIVITSIEGLPSSPFNGTPYVGVIITSGFPSYFKISGANLDRIVSVQWYPQNPASVLMEMRQVILVDNTTGTFMVQVLDNYLDKCDRGGRLSFRLDDDSTLHYPVKTYGPVSIGPLWDPGPGLITG
jgi:hypothetical protein